MKKNENKNQIQPRRKHQAFGRNFQGLPSLCGEDGKNHRKDGRNRKLKKETMIKYHLTVLGYYNNWDTTYQTSIICDGMNYSQAGCNEFWVNKDDSFDVIAYYPIRQTIITSIEQLKSKQWE